MPTRRRAPELVEGARSRAGVTHIAPKAHVLVNWSRIAIAAPKRIASKAASNTRTQSKDRAGAPRRFDSDRRFSMSGSLSDRGAVPGDRRSLYRVDVASSVTFVRSR